VFEDRKGAPKAVKREEETILTVAGEQVMVIHGRQVDFEKGDHITVHGRPYRVAGWRRCGGEIEFYLMEAEGT